MYSSILACNSFRMSVGDHNSRTKSGQIRSKCSLGLGLKASHRDLRINEASGERFAPFGNVKRVLESHTTPRPFCLAQFASCRLISAFVIPVIGFVGDMMMISFWAVSSIRASGL